MGHVILMHLLDRGTATGRDLVAPIGFLIGVKAFDEAGSDLLVRATRGGGILRASIVDTLGVSARVHRSGGTRERFERKDGQTNHTTGD
jgi:hypothetical protein